MAIHSVATAEMVFPCHDIEQRFIPDVAHYRFCMFFELLNPLGGKTDVL